MCIYMMGLRKLVGINGVDIRPSAIKRVVKRPASLVWIA